MHRPLLILALLACVATLPAHAANIVIPPGDDLLQTLPGSSLSLTGTWEIPPDFFGPGSDPFSGIVQIIGGPQKADSLCGSSDSGGSDTVIRRIDPINLADPPAQITIDIEIVAMELVSAAPITVTFGGNRSSRPGMVAAAQQWDIRIEPIPIPAPDPNPNRFPLLLDRDAPFGGFFDFQPEESMVVHVKFDRVGPPMETKTFTPPPDPYGGQGRWGIPAEIPPAPPSGSAQTTPLDCPSCKTDQFYLGYDGVTIQSFTLSSPHLTMIVQIPCTPQVVPIESTTWGRIKAQYRE